VKEISFKLGEYGNNYMKKDKQLIKVVLMNLRTPFDMFNSNSFTSEQACGEDVKDYTFKYLCGILILINIVHLIREILVENTKPTFSRERESQITRKEDSLVPLYKDLDALTKNLKGK
jgi:hypothetical protein